MNIIAHRGMWDAISEKNSIQALTRALDFNIGIETDIRDFNGELVISHDVPDGHSLRLEELLDIYTKKSKDTPLALNIKADGLQKLLLKLLKEYSVKNYFLFDMSVPELVINKNMNLPFYTRQSDIEPIAIMYAAAEGVWLDSFYDDKWITSDLIMTHVRGNKKICIVSSELHRKNHESMWEMLKNGGLIYNELVSLCTDFPEEAWRYFDE